MKFIIKISTTSQWPSYIPSKILHHNYNHWSVSHLHSEVHNIHCSHTVSPWPTNSKPAYTKKINNPLTHSQTGVHSHNSNDPLPHKVKFTTAMPILVPRPTLTHSQNTQGQWPIHTQSEYTRTMTHSHIIHKDNYPSTQSEYTKTTTHSHIVSIHRNKYPFTQSAILKNNDPFTHSQNTQGQ